jgi:hypothetical protein
MHIYAAQVTKNQRPTANHSSPLTLRTKVLNLTDTDADKASTFDYTDKRNPHEKEWQRGTT